MPGFDVETSGGELAAGLEFPIVHEDARIVVVAKPAGVTVIPARDEPADDCLQHRLQKLRGHRLWVVHRIDRDTSGLVVFARTESSHRALSEAFEQRIVVKHYVAFTRGVPDRDYVDVALHAARKGRMRPALPGETDTLPSDTHLVTELVADTAEGPVARVRARPVTGRQHQIRVHLRAANAPLLVDATYGKCDGIAANQIGPDAPAMPRLTLHAAALQLPYDPPLLLEAPMPPDLAALDAWLETRKR